MVFLSPGVKTRELDFSTYVPQLATTIVGLVGTAQKGDLNTPTFISSPAQLLDAFGDPIADSHAGYAALQFLLKGSQLWFVRVGGETAASAEVKFYDTSGRHTLTFTAKSPGTWLNNWTLTVSNVSGNAFRCTLSDSNGYGIEQFECTMDRTEDAYVETAINGVSRYFTVEDETPTEDNARVLEAAIGLLTGGHNGIDDATVSTATYASYNLTCTDQEEGENKNAFKAQYKTKGVAGNHYSVVISAVQGSVFTMAIRNDTPTAASYTFKNNLAEDALRVSTVATGAGVPVYHAKIEDSLGLTFTLIFEDAANEVLETYAGCSMDPTSDHFVETEINGVSELFVVDVLDEAANQGMLNTTAQHLTGNLAYTTLETYTDISTNPASSVYLVDYVQSDYLTFEAWLNYAVTLTAGTFALTGGSAGVSTTEHGVLPADYIGTGTSGLQSLTDTDVFDVNLLMAPGVTDAAVLNEILAISERRGDCMGILDTPDALTPQGVVNWHNGTGYDHQAFNSSYGAMYYPWIKMYDPYTKDYRYCPPSGYVSMVYAHNDNVGEPWLAPAGFNRGRIVEAVNVARDMTQGDRDLLYSGGNAINPIKNFAKNGITVWGQRTLQRRPSALDRVNVRRLLLTIRKAIAVSTAYTTFEPNDAFTWRNWVGMIEPFMESIRSRRGVYGYKVVMDSSTVTNWHIDNYQMPGQVILQPTKAAEFILVDFILTKTGASFTERTA